MKQRTRPRLLVSVRDAAEAEAALAGGADWIDLKEPAQGPLGAVDAGAAREVVACVAARAPVSAAAGELVEWSQAPARALLDVDGLTMVKLGLSHCATIAWQTAWLAVRAELASRKVELAAVAYADRRAAAAPSYDSILDLVTDAGATWILLDTFNKSEGVLLDHTTPLQLQRFLATARSRGMQTAVAGSLSLTSIADLPLALVDVVAVRGAACRGGRQGRVCRERVAAVAAALRDGCALRIPPFSQSYA